MDVSDQACREDRSPHEPRTMERDEGGQGLDEVVVLAVAAAEVSARPGRSVEEQQRSVER